MDTAELKWLALPQSLREDITALIDRVKKAESQLTEARAQYKSLDEIHGALGRDYEKLSAQCAVMREALSDYADSHNWSCARCEVDFPHKHRQDLWLIGNAGYARAEKALKDVEDDG
jgi:hypothetical protein